MRLAQQVDAALAPDGVAVGDDDLAVTAEQPDEVVLEVQYGVAVDAFEDSGDDAHHVVLLPCRVLDVRKPERDQHAGGEPEVVLYGVERGRRLWADLNQHAAGQSASIAFEAVGIRGRSVLGQT